MTEAFRTWYEETYEVDLPMGPITDAHFWLSAFVREVRRDSLEESGSNDNVRLVKAFERLVRDFGLEKTNE